MKKSVKKNPKELASKSFKIKPLKGNSKKNLQSTDRQFITGGNGKPEKLRMEEEISRLTKELSESTGRLEQVNDELDSFCYSVSHDLRAPLRAIHGYTKILMEDHTTALEADAKELMEVVLDNANKMNRLMDDLLALSRMGRKEMVLEKVNMADLIGSILGNMKAYFPEPFKTGIDTHDLLPLTADASLIKLVMTNLIHNAIKFSSKKEKPKVEISSYMDKNEIIYCIKDNGEGFDMEYYYKLFGVFQRLHSDAEFEGTGMGLALVKKIINRHNGRVWAKAVPGKGAAFYFALNAC